MASEGVDSVLPAAPFNDVYMGMLAAAAGGGIHANNSTIFPANNRNSMHNNGWVRFNIKIFFKPFVKLWIFGHSQIFFQIW